MPFDRSKYPSNWDEISHQIRFVRAGGQCEAKDLVVDVLDVLDGSVRYERCQAKHGEPHPITGSKVVLTTAHLEDENPLNCDPSNLAAYCQKHHLAYDQARRKYKKINKWLMETIQNSYLGVVSNTNIKSTYEAVRKTIDQFLQNLELENHIELVCDSSNNKPENIMNGNLVVTLKAKTEIGQRILSNHHG